MMVRRREKLDLPDFLHDDALLPLSSGIDDYYYKKQPVKSRPSFKQILRWKRLHHALSLFLVVYVLHFMYTTAQRYHISDRLRGPTCYYNPVTTPPSTYPIHDTDWSKYAYAQYATDKDYLCNSIMTFESLHRLGSKASRVLMYPKGLTPLNDTEYRLLLKANRDYNVSIVPVELQHSDAADFAGPNWANSYTKLLAFNQTQYSRIIMLDSDSVILQHMDELFFLPSAPIALPRAYWEPKPTLGSYLMLIEPSIKLFEQVYTAIKKYAGYGVYDMEIVNKLFGNTCVRLPHEKYAMLSGEFRSKDHIAYLETEKSSWNGTVMFADTKMIHFSDYPLPKPWEATWAQMQEAGPKCIDPKDGMLLEKCDNREAWFKLYHDFRVRRKEICQFDSPR